MLSFLLFSLQFFSSVSIMGLDFKCDFDALEFDILFFLIVISVID